MTTPRRRLARAARRVRWRYHFTDMRTGTLLATLPVRDARLSQMLNGPSDGAGVVPINAQTIARNPYTATTPRRSCMWAERAELDATTGRVVASSIPWGGIVMDRDRDLGGRDLRLALVTWESYWQHRLIKTQSFTQADRFVIARALADWGARQPDGVVPPHLTPVVAAGNLAGALMDRTYDATTLTPVLEAMQRLSAAGDGFDWRLVPYRDTDAAATFRLRLDLGYPRLGRIAPADLAWSTGDLNNTRSGQLLGGKVKEAGSGVLNRVTALGSGSGPTQLRAVIDGAAVGRDELAAGYPLYEGSLQSSTEDLVTLDSVQRHARGAILAGFAGEVQLTGIRVRGDLAPTVPTYLVGDDGTFRIGESTTGQAATIVGQIVARTIEPSQQGRTEQVTMDIQGTAVA